MVDQPLAEKSPGRSARAALKRFEVLCTLRLREKIDQFKVRWERSGVWGSSGAAWVAEPSDCRIK